MQHRKGIFFAILAALLSLILFQQIPDPLYFAALGFMILGARLSAQDGPLLPRRRSKQR